VNHVTSVTHVSGRIILQNVVGTAVTLTGTALDVNCTGCSAATVVEVDHVSSVTHVAGRVMLSSVAGTAVTLTSTSLDVNVTNAVAVTQSGEWNVRHVTSVTHVGANITAINGRIVPQGVVDLTNSALQVNCVVGCSSGGTISHVTSVTHIYGTVSVVSQAGTYATFRNSTSVAVTDVGGQSGTWTIQAAHQGGEWNVRHVSSVTHVAGTVSARIGFTVADVSCHEATAIHQTASTQVIHGVGGFRIGLCSIVIVSAHAQGLSIVAGQGTTCQTGQRPLIGGITTGSLKPSNSVVVAASGGFSSVANSPWLLTPQAVDNVCLMESGTGPVSGVITWRPLP